MSTVQSEITPIQARGQTIGRRAFMARGVVVVAVVASGDLWKSVFAGETDVAKMTAATFQPLIGQPFKMGASSEVFVLDEVKMLPWRQKQKVKLPPGVRQEPFSLLFSAPEGTELPAQLQIVSNVNLGSISLHLQQVRRMSSFSNANLLGHAERVAGMLSQALIPEEPKAYFEAIFS